MSSNGYRVADGNCPTCGQMFPEWTPDEIISAVRGWIQEYGSPPTRDSWGRRAPDRPTSSHLQRVFGSWTAAMVAAGAVEHRRTWTNQAILDALLDWRVRHGRWPKTRDWRQATYEHPTSRVVYLRFGSWATAIALAGGQPDRREHVPAGPVREAVREWLSQDRHLPEYQRSYTLRNLASEAGVSERLLGALMNGERPSLRDESADRILTALGRMDVYAALRQPDPAPPSSVGGRVDGAPPEERRVQAGALRDQLAPDAPSSAPAPDYQEAA